MEDADEPAQETCHGQKILDSFVVQFTSQLDGAAISEVEWPANCLLVAIQRGSEEIIPRGRTRLQTGDVLVAMTNESDVSAMIWRMCVIKCRNCAHPRFGFFGFHRQKNYGQGSRYYDTIGEQYNILLYDF